MLKVGQTMLLKRIFMQTDFDRFAALSGDDNPIHVSPEFCSTTRFSRTVSHGMLLYTAISGLLSAALPGAVQLEQELMFPGPTYTDEEVTVKLEVTEVQPEKNQAWLDTLITTSDGTVTCQGRTLIRLPEQL